MKNHLLWAMIALATTGVATADGYRWVDEEGNVVYSQSPPPGEQQAERLQLPAPSSVTQEPAEATTSDEETEDAEQPATVEDMDPAVRQGYCAKAKKNVELLKNTEPGVPFITEDNNVVKFSDAEKAQRLQQAQEAVEAYCNPEAQ
jgi:hypothetical protein